MKTEIAIGLICAILVYLLFPGCTQLIVEPDRFQVNTFLMTSGLDTLYFDPNGFLEVGKYSGIPANIKLKFNPFLNQYEMVIENNLERK